MTDHARARKLADRIRVVVAETLERQVKDPRLGFITITDARVTGDLHDATVFYTVLGDDNARTDTAAALEGVLDNVQHIDELLAKAREADAAVHEVAAHAEPAGDADPYRAPRDTEE